MKIINDLARKFGLRGYLKICTPTMGNLHAQNDHAVFNSVQRLVYRFPPEFDDGMPNHFRLEGEVFARSAAFKGNDDTNFGLFRKAIENC